MQRHVTASGDAPGVGWEKSEEWYFFKSRSPREEIILFSHKLLSDSQTVCWEIYLSYLSNFSLLRQQKETLWRQLVFKIDQKTMLLFCQTTKVSKGVFTAHWEKVWIFSYFRWGDRGGYVFRVFLMFETLHLPRTSNYLCISSAAWICENFKF